MAADALTFKQAMRLWPTGVAVVTTILEELPHGFTANAMTSLSLEPPSLLICVNQQAHSHAMIAHSGIFCVNILASTQQSLAEHFSKSGDSHKFSQLTWSTAAGGAPRLEGCVAWFDCALTQEHRFATHTIFIGNIRDCGHTQGHALGYVHGTYRDFSSLPKH